MKLIEENYAGLNERVYPSAAPQNVFSNTNGVTYRSGQACRINGKKLITKLPNAVLSIFPLPNSPFAILQTLDKVYSIPLALLFIPPSGPLQTQDGEDILTELEETISTDPA